MKRAPWYVFAGAIAGFAGVVGMHGRPAASSALSAPKGHQAGRGARQGTGSGTKPGASSQPGAPSVAASGPARSATGPLEQYGYGQLDVTVTVRGNRITGVSVPTLQTAEQYSQQLAAQVIPMLKSEVLSSQTARINGVSGATYTSEAYAMSLQSALDKLHVK